MCRNPAFDLFLDRVEERLRPSIVLADDQAQEMVNVLIAPVEEDLDDLCERLAWAAGSRDACDRCLGVSHLQGGECVLYVRLIRNWKARHAPQARQGLQYVPSRELSVGFEQLSDILGLACRSCAQVRCEIGPVQTPKAVQCLIGMGEVTALKFREDLSRLGRRQTREPGELGLGSGPWRQDGLLSPRKNDLISTAVHEGLLARFYHLLSASPNRCAEQVEWVPREVESHGRASAPCVPVAGRRLDAEIRQRGKSRVLTGRADEARGGQELCHVGRPHWKAYYTPHTLSDRGFHREREAVHVEIRTRDERWTFPCRGEPTSSWCLAAFPWVIEAEVKHVPDLFVAADGLVHIHPVGMPKAVTEQARSRWSDKSRQVGDFADGSIDGDWIRDASPELALGSG